jgi:hypothetical protein
MTVIVWDGEILAADKQATDDGVRRTVTKIRRVEKGRLKGFLMAGSGACSQANTMMAWFESGANPSRFPKYQEDPNLSAVLTIITPDKLILRYEYTPNPIVFEDAQYCTGSGRDIAYGALYMGANAIEAVEVVCEYMSDCGMGIDAIYLNEKKGKKK